MKGEGNDGGGEGTTRDVYKAAALQRSWHALMRKGRKGMDGRGKPDKISGSLPTFPDKKHRSHRPPFSRFFFIVLAIFQIPWTFVRPFSTVPPCEAWFDLQDGTP
jgi:hypothetical protein